MGVAWLRTGSVAILAAALAGCGTSSVVNSTSVISDTGGAPGKAGPAYLTYYLPQTVLAVKLAAKAPGGGGDDKAGGATATATVTNAITIDGKAAKLEAAPEAGGGGAKPKPKAVCDQAMERYNLLQASHAAYTVKRVSDLEALRVLANGPLATAAQQAAADKAQADFVKDAKLDDDRVRTAARIAKHVPEVCAFQVEVTITQEVAPDLVQAYRLRAPDDSLSADSFTLKIAENGLLTSVSTVADDKTAEAANGAFKSIGTIIGVTYSGGGTAVTQKLTPAKASSSVSAQSLRGKPKRPTEAQYRQAFLIEIAKFEEATIRVAELPILEPKLPSYPLRYALEDLVGVDGKAAITPLAETGYYLRLACSALPTMASGEKSPVPSTDGILVSSPRACVGKVASPGYAIDATGAITATPLDPAKAEELFKDKQRWALTVLDSRRPLTAVLQRTRMVKRSHGYEFKDGQLSQVTYDKPSDGAALVALPGNLIGSVFSGLSAGLQGRQGTYKDRAGLLDAQASVYNSQAALIKAQADLETAKKAQATAVSTDATTK